MKIKEFFVSYTGTNIDISSAVRDIMLLFKVESAGAWPEGARLTDLTTDSLLVVSCVKCSENEVSVSIVISFCIQTGKIESLTESACRPMPLTPAKGDDSEDVTGLVRRLVRLTVLRLMQKLTGNNPAPWGILRGVRPTKIVHRLLDQGLTDSQITAKLIQEYALEPAKAVLVTGIAIHQRTVIASPDNPGNEKKISIYIGIPYCPSRCLYCSFPAYVLPERREQLDAFLLSIARDIKSTAQLIARFNLSVESIYVGGGTPTSLSAADLASLLSLINESFKSGQTKEFTVEAGRPDSIDNEKIDVLRQSGVNRVSINPQTMQDKTLKQIGRRHTVQDIIDIFGKIRLAGIPLVNMDVIAGLPGETEADMEDTMRQIAILNPENITVHTLALKRGSILKESLSTGTLLGEALPSEEVTRAMLKLATDYVTSLDMHPYYLYRQKYMTGNLENIGYAKADSDCLYNIQIMEERQTIIGIGPGAGTKAVSPNQWRLQSSYNAKDVVSYIKNLDIYLNERNTLLSRLFGDCKEE